MKENIRLSDDFQKIENILDVFYASTGISIKFVDKEGKTILETGDNFSFCNFFHTLTSETINCEQTHHYAGLQSLDLGEAYIFFCHAGLTEITYPVIDEGVYSGAFVAGPLLMAFPDEYFVDEIIKKNDLSLEHKSKIKSYVRTIPKVEPERVRYLSQLLQMMIIGVNSQYDIKMRKTYSKKEQQREIHYNLSTYSNQDYASYPVEKEQELLKYVKVGDSKKAKALLNDLLGYIFYETGVNIEISKSRALEMSALISRAAMEGGANQNLMLSLNNEYAKGLSSINTMDELSFWMLDILENFTDQVFSLNNRDLSASIRKSLDYIHNGYMEKLSLNSAAEISGLNSKYYSFLFKKEMGVAFSQYVNDLRIGEAKRMLINTRMTILDIALHLGYEDHSYFTKVFKKKTTLTPLQYRKRNG